MPNYPNAPLIYTIGVVRFPPVPEFDRFVDKLHDQLRGDYPFKRHAKIPVITANFGGPNGLEVRQEQEQLFEISDAEKKWSFIFGREMFGLHTIKYNDHVDFINRFENGLKALLAIPDIGIKFLVAAGIRYVDLVVPKENETLDKYIEPWALPQLPSDLVKTSNKQGMYITNYQTSAGTLRIQVLLNPPAALPPELQTHLIVSAGWVQERPKEDFALLDLDHGSTFDPPIELTAKIAREKLLALRTSVRAAFDNAGTKFAHATWGRDN